MVSKELSVISFRREEKGRHRVTEGTEECCGIGTIVPILWRGTGRRREGGGEGRVCQSGCFAVKCAQGAEKEGDRESAGHKCPQAYVNKRVRG